MAAQRLPFVRALERFENCGAETHQAILEDVVRRACLEIRDRRFFIQRSRDQDEGDVGKDRAGLLQSPSPIKCGKVVIAQDHVRGEVLERGEKRCFARHTFDLRWWSQSPQLMSDEPLIVRIVLQQQHAHRWHEHSFGDVGKRVCRR